MAASAARSVGRRHEARRSRLVRGGRALRARPLVACVCGPLRGPGRFGSALRLRAARPRRWFCALHAGAPSFARLVSIRRPRLRLVSWSVVSAARACCGLLRRPQRVRAVFSAACCVVSLGVSFLKRSLRARPAPAAVSFRRGRCHGPCFSALANPRLGFAAPGSFGESRARQSAVKGSWE